MPIAQIMLFGFAITNEINNVNIAILDKSKDTETEIIINKISVSISISNRRLVLSLK
jgi:ABC-2 type transport system permease protein